MKLPDFTALSAPQDSAPAERTASYDATSVGKAEQGFGTALNQAGGQLKDVLDVADVNNAFANEYTPKATELASNYYSLTGKAAVDALPQFTEQMGALRQQTVDSLGGSAARKLEGMIQGHQQQELYRAGMHSAQQARVYSTQSFAAVQDNDLNEISDNVVGNAPQAADAETRAAENLRQQLQLEGTDPNGPIGQSKMRELQTNVNLVKQAAVQKQLLSLPADTQISLLQSISHGQSSPGTPSTAPVARDDVIGMVMDKLEGSALNPNDNGHGPSKYGIVGSGNGLTPQQVTDLTPDQAKQIYIDKYWKPAGIDSLPDNMKMVAFDTAVQFGVGTAKGMIAQAGNDPQRLIDIRNQKYQAIIASDPDRYGASAQTWQNRTSTLSQMMGGTPQQGEAVGNPTLFGVPIDPSTVPKLMSIAEASKAREDRLAKDANEAATIKTEQDFIPKWQANNLKPEDVMQSNLTPGKQIEWLNRIKEGPANVNPNDPAVIKQRGVLENMKVEDPEAFKALDLSTMAGKVPASDISNLQNDQLKMKQNDTSLDGQNRQAKQITDSVVDMLPKALQKPKTQSDIDNASAFKGQLALAVKDAQAAGGKPLSRDDIRGIASDMLGDVSIKGGIWDSSTKAYQIPAGTNPLSVYRGDDTNIYVPVSFRTGLTKAWQERTGQPPKESDIRTAYLKSVTKK